MRKPLRSYLAGAALAGGRIWLTLLPPPGPGPPRAATTQDYDCPPGVSVTRVYRPGRGATPAAAVDALIRAWYPDATGQTVERLLVHRPGDPHTAVYLLRRGGEPFETILVRRAPHEGRSGYEATLDQVCGRQAAGV